MHFSHATPTPANALSTLVSYYVAVVLVVITLLPFQFHVPTAVTFSYSANRFDVIANIRLLVPFGFLLTLLSVPGRSVTMIAGIG